VKRKLIGSALLASVLINLSGCANQAALPRTPVIAVVSSESWVFEWKEYDETEVDLHICIAKALHARNADVVSQNEFMAIAFPNMHPDKAPRTPEFLEIALTHPEVHQRVADRGIEYLVYVTGEIDYENGWLAGGCTYGGGCFFYGEEDETSRLTAVLIDTKLAQRFSQHSAEKMGQTWVSVIGVVPIWNEAEPGKDACIELSDNIYSTLKAESNRWNNNRVEQAEAEQ
jgi:hypothetical protein